MSTVEPELAYPTMDRAPLCSLIVPLLSKVDEEVCRCCPTCGTTCNLEQIMVLDSQGNTPITLYSTDDVCNIMHHVAHQRQIPVDILYPRVSKKIMARHHPGGYYDPGPD